MVLNKKKSFRSGSKAFYSSLSTPSVSLHGAFYDDVFKNQTGRLRKIYNSTIYINLICSFIPRTHGNPTDARENGLLPRCSFRFSLSIVFRFTQKRHDRHDVPPKKKHPHRTRTAGRRRSHQRRTTADRRCPPGRTGASPLRCCRARCRGSAHASCTTHRTAPHHTKPHHRAHRDILAVGGCSAGAG